MVAVLAPTDPITGKVDDSSTEIGFDMNLAVIINEIVCTFIFVSVILMVKGKHTAGDRKGIGAAMVVVLTLLGVIAATNKYGACFNPAVGTSLTLNQVLRLGHARKFYHYLYAYTVGPAIGGLFAGLFHIVHAKAHEPIHGRSHTDESQVESFLQKNEY